jgi:hypothetical protein
MAIRSFLGRSAPVSLLAALVCAAAARPDDPKPADPAADRSVVLSARKAPSTKVENGAAFDSAVLDLAGRTRLVVPDNAEVLRGAAGGTTRVYLKKTLGFGGHPPEPMSIRTVRKYMGCATKAEGEALVLGTFGEWKSKEGGSRIKLVVVVPAGVEVEKVAGLSGPESAARPPVGGPYLTKPRWTVVPVEPDPDHRADLPAAGYPPTAALAVCGGFLAAVPWPQPPAMR